MFHRKRYAKVNVKLLLVLILVIVVIGISLVVARHVRRGILSQRALVAAQAAFEKEDWSAAAGNFRYYLIRNPTDVEILKKYGRALLAVRPLKWETARTAIGVYNQVIRLAPQEDAAYQELAALCQATNQFELLARVAQMRLQHAPTDCEASMWLARAMVGLKKTQEARQTLLSLIGTLDSLSEKHEEYVQACLLMSEVLNEDEAQPAESIRQNEDPGASQVVAEGIDANEPETPLQWLDRAVRYMPDSVEALLSRAQFYRRMAGMSGTSEPNRPVLLALARQDLEAADAKNTDNALIRYLLAVEWLAHDALDQAIAELSAMDRLPQSAVEKHFADSNDWSVARFRVASKVATRRGATAEAALLADDILKVLTEKRHRAQVLPVAARFYLAVGRLADANDCLAEYANVPPSLETPEYSLQIAWLRALVAMAAERPYEVIDILQSVVRTDPLSLAAGDDSYYDPWQVQAQMWQLLVEAYRKTNQPQRAVTALTAYLDSLRRYQLHQGQRDQDTQLVRRLVAEASQQLVRAYAEARDWDRAFDLAQAVAPLSSDDFTFQMLCLRVAVNQAVARRGQESAETLRKLSAQLADLRHKHPDVVDIPILQATISNYFDRSEEAENELKKAVAQCEEPLSAEMMLARHYQRAGRLDEAVGVCQAACERHPEIPEPRLMLSDLYVARENYDAARRCLREGLDRVEGPEAKASLSIQLAMVDLVHGDPNDGISLLCSLAEGDPRQTRARELLLAVRKIREDRTTTQKLIDELRQAEGESGVRWRFHQANLWLSSSDWHSRQKDAIELLQYCIDADRTSSPSVLLLADLYERLGDLQTATGVCRRALAANPAAADVTRRLLHLLEKQGRSSEAGEITRRPGIDPDIVSDWQVYSAAQAGDLPRAISELELRVSNDDGEDSRSRVVSRIRLAILVYGQTKDTERALQYLQEAEAITPDALSIIGVRAWILAAAGRAQEAHRILDDYVVAHNDFNAYWLRASQFLREGDVELAQRDFRKLTTFTGQGTRGYILLANFYASLPKLDQAVAVLDEGLNTYPSDLELRRSLLRMLMQRGRAEDLEKADVVLKGLEEQLPQDPELMTFRALQILRESTPQAVVSAEGILQDAVRLDPMAVDTQLALIDVALRRGANEAACAYAMRALESNPRNPMLLSAWAKAELVLGNPPIAAKLAQQALQQDPNNIEAVDIFVQAALRSGDSDLLAQARRLIDAAVHGDPASERLLISRAHVYTALNRPQGAIPELEAYCQTEPGSGSIATLLTLADMYRIVGDMVQADRVLRQAERLDASSQIVVHGRTLLLVSQKRFDDLKQISAAYISADQQNPATVLQAASTLMKLDSLNLKREAVKLLEHAVNLAPASVDARRALALGLYQTGDLDGAERVYRQLLAQFPNDVGVLNNLAWLLQQHGQRYDEALELANRGLRLSPGNLYLLDTRGTILSNLPDRLADARSDFEELVQLSRSDPQRQEEARLKLDRVCAALDARSEVK